MKKVLIAAFFLFGFSNRAHAVQRVIESIGGDTGVNSSTVTATSTATVMGIICTSGTAVQIDNPAIGRYGYNRAWVRVTDLDAANAVWIGQSSGISTGTASGSITNLRQLGELIVANGGNATYPFGRILPIYCKAPDVAGAAGVVVSVFQVGYK